MDTFHAVIEGPKKKLAGYRNNLTFKQKHANLFQKISRAETVASNYCRDLLKSVRKHKN